MSNSDFFFDMLSLAGIGVGTYFIGKTQGVQKTIQKYELENVLRAQNDTIKALHEELERMKRAQGFTSRS